jgi:mycothione reductase
MKEYDLIIIGTGSAMNIAGPFLHQHPDANVAVIDKDDPGGICLTRGCIPSKLLLYPADLVRTAEKGSGLGIEMNIGKVHFNAIMERMRLIVSMDILQIRESLKASPAIDYYPHPASFTGPSTLVVEGETIKGNMIFLCTGSKPLLPDIPGLEESGYYDSDSFLDLEELPERWVIIGGGYIAAEYGHFLSAMGAEVTVLGRNPQFLKEEEPEISGLAQKKMAQYMTIHTGAEVTEVRKGKAEGSVTVSARTRDETLEIGADAVLVASGRASNSDILNPQAGGIETTPEGWIKVNSSFETSCKNVWAFGDATGKHLFKHVANYESEIVYYNAVTGEDPPLEPDYRAVPHAVFTYPEIAAVGMREAEAVERYGEENIAVGFSLFEQTAKGMAMDLQESGFFVKVLLHDESEEILGAHIIGPEASVLIHEILAAMNSSERTFPYGMMHIHPALSEVVANAFGELMSIADYHHLLSHLNGTADHDHHDHDGDDAS